MLDVGTLFGSLVGQTEANVRQVLRQLDAMAPCIAFLDEIDKGFSGVASSGQTDSGVGARMFGSFLAASGALGAVEALGARFRRNELHFAENGQDLSFGEPTF